MSTSSDLKTLLLSGLTTNGAFVWMLIPLLSIGGIGAIVLMAVISKKVDENGQGQLQGGIASLQGLATIVGPVLMLNIYFLSRQTLPGPVRIIGAVLYLFMLSIVLRRSIYK